MAILCLFLTRNKTADFILFSRDLEFVGVLVQKCLGGRECVRHAGNVSSTSTKCAALCRVFAHNVCIQKRMKPWPIVLAAVLGFFLLAVAIIYTWLRIATTKYQPAEPHDEIKRRKGRNIDEGPGGESETVRSVRTRNEHHETIRKGPISLPTTI